MTAQAKASKGRRIFASLGVLLIVAPMSAATVPQATASPSLADPAFQRVWNHCDKPVNEGVATRTWMWGPDNFHTAYEPYMEGHGGQHLVTYFDKSRMEINNPDADRNSEWYVTNGLLVVDMVSGSIQVGNNAFAPAVPAAIPVAGDTAASIDAPTYAALARVASLKGDNRAPNRTGQSVREGLGRDGNFGTVNNLAGLATYAVYEPTLGHNIPSVFWSFMNQKGTTYHDTGYITGDLLINWVYAMGYPITEPYWIKINVGGQDRWVLMQAFQRRILTYSPYNPEGWKVEMGNVGRAYFDWRYSQQVIQPTPIPTPLPAPKPSLTIDPTRGDVHTQITAAGKNFPASTQVVIAVERASANYYHNVTTANSDSKGAFTTKFKLPIDTATFDEVTISASANNGAVRATQTYRLQYGPSVALTPGEVVPNGAVRVTGEGYPPRADIRVGLVLGGGTQWLKTVGANDSGEFDVTVGIGNLPVGTRFNIVALAENGVKATSDSKVTVIAQPGLRVIPNSGPAGAYVTLQGFSWPAGRSISLGTRLANNQTEAWLPNPVRSDASGNFSVAMWIWPEYSQYREARLIAVDSSNGVRVEASYFITAQPTPTPIPTGPSLWVYPSTAATGQEVLITGAKWPAGAQIELGLGHDGGMEEPVGAARADAAGNFTHRFILSNHWQGAGRIVLTGAVHNGPSATVPLWVAPAAGRIVPAGLPMTVVSTRYKTGPTHFSIRAAGWSPGSVVSVSVTSVDGAINTLVDTAAVKANGTFQASFDAAAPWWGRPDLGVHAVAPGEQQYSIRYLPYTDMTKIGGTGNTHSVTGANWPANTHIDVVLHLAGLDDEVLGSATTDANGSFALNVNLPRIPSTNKNDIEIKAADQPYVAWFDF